MNSNFLKYKNLRIFYKKTFKNQFLVKLTLELWFIEQCVYIYGFFVIYFSQFFLYYYLSAPQKTLKIGCFVFGLRNFLKKMKISIVNYYLLYMWGEICSYCMCDDPMICEREKGLWFKRLPFLAFVFVEFPSRMHFLERKRN